MTPSRWALVAVLAAVALAAGVAGGRLLLSVPPPAAAPAPPRAARPPVPSGPPPGFVEFRDELFSIAYPASWERRDAGEAEVEILATQGRTASFLVRVVPLDFEVGSANLETAKRLTDRVVRSGKGVKLIAPPQRSDLGGLPGYFYLYTFEDAEGERGSHSHYFLFRGDTMYTIVFQALPANRLSGLAPVFDQIAASFRPS